MIQAARTASGAERKRLQLLAHSAALRTALRRALAQTAYALTPDPVAPSDVKRAFDEARPDCLVLDSDLPGLRGLGLLQQMSKADPRLPIIVVVPEANLFRMRAEALEKGAIGVVGKPASDEPIAFRPVAEAIIEMLDSQFGIRSVPRGGVSAGARGTTNLHPAAPAHHRSVGAGAGAGAVAPAAPASPASQRVAAPALARRTASPAAAGGPEGAPPRPPRVHRLPPQLLAVGSSTGGPQALITLFSGVQPSAVNVPVLIVQHMPAAFTPILAEHITRATDWTALEASADEPLIPGEIRIAPGGYHMIVCNAGGTRRLRLTNSPPVNFCRPSADVLFVSAAEVYGRGVLAVILTGMGNDGCQGAKVISAAGGAIYAQDRETSVVWGMPGAAVGAGVVDRELPLRDIAPAVQAAMKGIY